MFHFLGIGSAFNTDLGNTSAFIKKNNSLVLIDCGGTVFHQINSLNLLENIRHLYIIITHTHPDHIGSLGEVIFYAYFVLKIKPIIYYPNKKLIKTLFRCLGIEKKMYVLKSHKVQTIHDENLETVELKFIPVSHLNTVKSYGFLFTYNHKTVYYSGDSNDIPKEILKLLHHHELDILYQDTCGLVYDGNAHLSLNKLTKLIHEKYRSQVYCIHHDQDLNLEEVSNLGFRIPSLYKGE